MTEGGGLIRMSEAKFKVWWDEENGILINKSWGDFEEEDAKNQATEILRMTESKPGKILSLNDMRDAGKASSAARKIYSKLMKNEKVAKHAFLGMRTLTKVIVSFIMKASGVNNIKFFSNEAEAVNWLKGV